MWSTEENDCDQRAWETGVCKESSPSSLAFLAAQGKSSKAEKRSFFPTLYASLSSQLRWNLLNLILLGDQFSMQKDKYGSSSLPARWHHGVFLAALRKGERTSVPTAVTKYHSLSGLNNRHLFSHNSSLGSSRPRCQPICFLVRAFFLAYRWPQYHGTFSWWKERILVLLPLLTRAPVL